MTPEEIAANEAATAAAKAEADAKAKAEADSQNDPLKKELDKVQKKGQGKTELEKLLFTEKKIQERKAELLREEGIEEPEEDESKPITVGDLKKRDREQSQKTALSLADEISNETERELTKHHIQNTIRPSGNPNEDLRNARAIVNNLKNSQIIEEAARRAPVKTGGAGGGAPAKSTDATFEPTPDEVSIMSMKGLDGKPLLSEKDIIEARKKTA